MRAKRITTTRAGLALLCLLIPSGGCGWGLLAFMNTVIRPPEEVPAALDAVLAGDVADCGDPNDAAEMPAQAVPVDDPAALDGCWGGCLQSPSRLPGRDFDLAEVLEFDSAEGTLKRSIYQSIVIVPPLVDVQIGTFTLDEAGVATYHVTQILSSVNSSDPGTLVDISDHWKSLPVYEVQLAFDGDRLVAWFGEIDTPRTSGGFADRRYLHHVQMDCP